MKRIIFSFRNKYFSPEQFKKFLKDNEFHLVGYKMNNCYAIYTGGYYTGRVFGTVTVIRS